MKSTVIIHQGRAGMENPKYPMPDRKHYILDDDGVECYQKARQLALDNLIYFEDQERIIGLLIKHFGGQILVSTSKYKDGVYEVDLPESSGKS